MQLKQFLLLILVGYISIYFIQVFFFKKHKNNVPVILWWTPFSRDGKITCSNNFQCIISNNHDDLLINRNLKAVLFYGSNIDESNLPQKNNHVWGIYHEESPKNLPIFMNKEIQNLFEITSTFSRFSSFPLTLQYLKSSDDIISKEYYVDLKTKNNLLKNLAPVLYIQKDCLTPISRDEYVTELMKYVKVDSYGDCLNNKKLPDEFKLKNGMYDLFNPKFMRFVANYKFIITIENAQCEDYITEKLWRSLIVGSIPIYLGSPSIKDWLPNKQSVLLVNEFKSPKDLAKEIIKINNNDELYETYMDHKLKNHIANKRLTETLSVGNYGLKTKEDYTITAFECYVCDELHLHLQKYKHSQKSNKSVYNCLQPKNAFWKQIWEEDDNKARDLIKRIS